MSTDRNEEIRRSDSGRSGERDGIEMFSSELERSLEAQELIWLKMYRFFGGFSRVIWIFNSRKGRVMSGFML